MKKKEIFIAFFLVAAIICFVSLNLNRSYSYGVNIKISGNKGSRELKYYDENNKEISIDTAIKYYGLTRYQKMYDSNGTVYFYNGKEITESKYKVGSASEAADNRALKYGDAGIRVSSTENFKKAWDNIFLNYVSGKFSFNWSPYDNINFEEVEKYVMSKYGVLDPKQNYYSYSVKGPQEPIRFALNLASYKDKGEFIYENYFTRHTGDEKKKVDYFLDNLFKTEMPPASASDYEKILASFVYITSHSRYYVDNGFINDYLSGFTSMYDNLLGEHPDAKNYGATNCIGYSVTFSYFMERYGIESYIVDGDTTLDVSKKQYTSNHTYNLVKLDGKFYRLDLTFGNNYFLIPMTPGILYNNKLNLATSRYTNTTPTYTFNEANITKYKNQAKNLKVTTTTKRALTTTKALTTSIKITTSKSTNLTANRTTTQSEYVTTIPTSSVDISSSTYSTTSSSTSSYKVNIKNTTTKVIEEEAPKEDKTLFNVIMIGAFVLILVSYVAYKVVSSNRKTRLSGDEMDAILNKSINNQVNNGSIYNQNTINTTNANPNNTNEGNNGNKFQ